MPTVRIVLVRARNALNMGAAARAMANFSLPDLALVQPYGAAWHTARSARAGAALLRSARVFDSLADAVADCSLVIGTTAGTARTPALPLEDWAAMAAAVSALPAEQTVAVLFGSEKTGLAVEDLSFCQRLARIPTASDAPSMNLGQAVAVCAYELARSATSAPAVPPAPGGPPLATAAERELVVQAWQPLLERVGAALPSQRAARLRGLRQMLLRWRLASSDAHILLGAARQIRHALDGRRDPPPGA